MIGKPLLFRKVTIIGVGLIGGSIGMAIKKERLAREVVGYSRSHSSVNLALKNGAIDEAVHDLKKALDGADLVILATPVKTIVQMFPMISRFLKRGCIVMDVGSTKTAIVQAAQKELPPYIFFVGCHPLTGSEKKGAANASAELFLNSLCLITPTDKTNNPSKERVKTLWSRIGAAIKFISPAEHDKYLAYVSHVPHLVAYALMAALPEDCLQLATPSLKDTTRVAASEPELWADICMTNFKNILQALDDIIKHLSSYRKAIVSQDSNSLIENFKKSKTRRDAIS